MAARWRREKQPRRGLGWRARPRLGSIWNGLKSNLPDRLEFLGPLPRKKNGEWRRERSSCRRADVSDGAGCAGVEDGVGRKEANEVKGEGGKGRKRRESSRACEETGSTWPSAYVHTGIVWPLRRTGIGVFTYIESLPTYNYRLPILPQTRTRLARRCLYAKFTRFA